jgi:hypothetical protein
MLGQNCGRTFFARLLKLEALLTDFEETLHKGGSI